MFRLFLFVFLYCTAVALNVNFQECLDEVTKRNATISVTEQEWLCENADSYFHKRRQHAAFKAAGYKDVNLFNRFYAWNASSTIQAYLHSQEYMDYQLELLVHQEIRNHQKDDAWYFVKVWKGNNSWSSLGGNATDIYNSWDKSDFSMMAEKWKRMVEIGHRYYPPFNEVWSFGQYYLKVKGWDYILRDNEMKHIVDEWRNSSDYEALDKRKKINHYLSADGYKASAYTQFCEKLDKLEGQNWSDFVRSCIDDPEFVNVDNKEKLKTEVRRLGFKHRDDFEAFWIWIHKEPKYQLKTPGSNTCPTGFSHITDLDECQKAQEEVASDVSHGFQGIPHPELPVSGCYLDTLHDRVYMPPASHGTGATHMHMIPICKKDQSD